MTAILKPQCCSLVYNSSAWRSYPCGKNAKVERDGKHYCGIHDPVARKAKDDSRMDKYNAETAARRASIDVKINEQKELERRAECFDDLLAALKNCAAVCAGEVVNKNGLINALEMARSAIEKATGAPK